MAESGEACQPPLRTRAQPQDCCLRSEARSHVALSYMSAALMPERLRAEHGHRRNLEALPTTLSAAIKFVFISLTALGMVIGTASLILVVTIGMTAGKQYVLNQIQAIGTNEVWAEYLGGRAAHQQFKPGPADHRKISRPFDKKVPGIIASSPVTQLS